ncbi:HIRAN domain-containing protein [Clostridium sp.]|uniref:HIRAN domain-containing protein n=1 Tax=Clostridium sp. TaxID=1506 RepID=UPI002843BED9|nr:HIRAN domain-containing protein [Clostridium sp.]MDR3597057.1 HIRAN domain-containing protein [Clostridium sp.]
MECYKFDRTKLERVKELEKAFNIEISFNAYLESRYDKRYIFIVGEIIGDILNYDILISTSVYDELKNLIIEQEVKLEADKFEGRDAFKFYIGLNDNVEVSKITVRPILRLMKDPLYKPGILPVVGITIKERKQYVKKINIGENVRLLREPNNPYDKNAIKVLDCDDNMLGYISKEWAVLYVNKLNVGDTNMAKIIEKKLKVILIETNIDCFN